jgi:hypothetical protein
VVLANLDETRGLVLAGTLASQAPLRGRAYVTPRGPRYPALGRPVTGETLPGLGGRESRFIPAATALPREINRFVTHLNKMCHKAAGHMALLLLLLLL